MTAEMDLLKNGIAVLSFLLTGFVAQWVFHGFTAHPRRSDLDRIIHALILTTLVAPLTWCMKKLLLWAGERSPIWWQWEDWPEQATGVVTAVLFGFFLAVCANNGWPHAWLNWQGSRRAEAGGRTFPGRLSAMLFGERLDGWLRRRSVVSRLSSIVLTKKTTSPSEWYNTFNRDASFWVVLHLANKRRLYG